MKLRSIPLAVLVLVTGLPIGAQTTAPATKTNTPENQTGATSGATMTPATTPASSNPSQPKNNDVYVLSPFTVSSTRDTGYAATDTLAGTQIRTNLSDVAASISVVTKAFMDDVGATDNLTLLQYTTNSQVSGTEGTYLGLGTPNNGVDEAQQLINPQGANRTRGLAPADNARNYFISDIPWDSFDAPRIDILRGPNSILFGLGSPAGMVNATTNEAEFRDFGSVSERTGSYGSNRATVDINKQIFKDRLAIRLDGLWTDQKYEQKPAYQKDKRLYGAVKFSPNLFNNPSFQTILKLNYEYGDITANRPRITPPNDSITPWFRPLLQVGDTPSASNPYGGAGMTLINNPYDAQRNTDVTVGDGRGTQSVGTDNYVPWINGRANQQQPMYFIDGSSNQLYRAYSGYTNNGWIDSNGNYLGGANAAAGLRYSGSFYGVNSLDQAAKTLELPLYQYGGYKTQSLTDPSIFDFYNNLIDGPTKSEWEHWNAYNIDLSQTGWNNRVGFEVTYDRQRYTRGGESLLGGRPTLSLDILKNFSDYITDPSADGTSATNPNVGRPYVESSTYNGSSFTSDRKDWRARLFAELRASDFLHSDFLVKLLGKHRFTGVGTDDKYFNESRSWMLYGNGTSYGNFVGQPYVDTRPPLAYVYLGPSIIADGQTSASGANIPGISAPVALQSTGVYLFNSQWNSGVSPAANWDVPANLQVAYAGYPDPTAVDADGNPIQLTQASNPANYVGWTTVQNSIVSYNHGENPTLLRGAQKQLRETKSMSGSYQGFFWNDAVVLTLGWRYDNVNTKGITAQKISTNRDIYDIGSDVYNLSDAPLLTDNSVKAHSTSGGVILHLNKLFPKDPLPINVSVGYDKSNNFQVVSVHRDLYGNELPDPSGKTKEYNLTLSTKDGKYSFRVVKYDTKVLNGTSTFGSSGDIGRIIQQGLRWRNVFLYQLGVYTMDTANTDSYRNRWTNAYPNETAAQAQQEEDAAINTWNDIQKHLEQTGFFQAWNFTPTNSNVLTDRTTYLSNPTQYAPDPATVYAYSATAPQGFTVTADQESKGYEFELTANPLPNWRLTFNASKTEAIQTNVGGKTLDDFVAYLTPLLVNADGTQTPAGMLPQYGGASNSMYLNIWSPFLADYNLLKAQQGAAVPEIRKWQYKLITNYDFDHGPLKNFGVGGGYRWYDKVAIGYPQDSQGHFDLQHPYYGPTEQYVDLWVSYHRKLSDKIDWKIQLNVRNVGKHDGLIPVSTEPDGTWATVRLAPVQEWFLTNTFSF